MKPIDGGGGGWEVRERLYVYETSLVEEGRDDLEHIVGESGKDVIELV